MLEKFSWGINIDNIWRYCGNPPPRSAIVPFLVSLRLARGPVEILEHPDTLQAIQEHLKLPDGTEPPAIVKELCDDLVDRLREARISFVRTWFPWNFFTNNAKEETATAIRFVLDTFVDTLKLNGIGVLGVLANGYHRFLPKGASVDRLDAYVKELAPFWAEIVSHYKGSVDIWQIENEPNWWKEHLAVNWRSGLIWLEPGAEEKIIGTLYNVVREENPKAKIVINIEADRHPVNLEFYAKYCDIMALDFYPAYAHPHRTTSAGEIKIVSEDVKRQVGKPLIIAETGQPSGPHILGYNEERQAQYIRSACEEAFSSDAIDALCIWRLSDSYWRSFPMQENYFGLLTKDMESKPAWSEYVNQIKDRI
jgi:hypothetical protein